VVAGGLDAAQAQQDCGPVHDRAGGRRIAHHTPLLKIPVWWRRVPSSERKKERKREVREGRTARRHHTGILRRGVWCASRRPPLGVRLFLSLFAVSRRFLLRPSCHLAVVPFSSCSRALPCRFFLCRVALLCRCCAAAAACRSLVLSASFAFRRSSALLAAYLGPSSLSSSPRARTSLLTPTAIICRPVISLLRSTLSSRERDSSNTCAFTDDAGAGVPFGCIVTADNGISTGSSSSETSRLPPLPSARLYVRYVRRGSPSMP